MWLNFQIARAGGVEKIFQIINPEFYLGNILSLHSKFQELIDSGIFENVSLPEGGETSFTGEEVAYMIERSKDVFDALDDRLAGAITEALASSRFVLTDSAEKLEEMLAVWTDYLINSGEGLDFRYSFDTRRVAAQLLKNQGPLPEWLKVYIPPIAEELKKNLEVGLGMPLDEVKLERFPRREREKLAAELQLYYMLVNTSRPVIPLSGEQKKDDAKEVSGDILLNQAWFLLN